MLCSSVRALSLTQQPPFGITGNKNIIINDDDDGSTEGPPSWTRCHRARLCASAEQKLHKEFLDANSTKQQIDINRGRAAWELGEDVGQ